MIKYLQLTTTFDAERMLAEVAMLDASAWMQHYNKTMYQGGWTVLPLRSINGSLDNIVSIHQGASAELVYRDTEFLQYCPYIQSVINFFECDKTTVRLMKLEPGATIKPHSDQELSFEEGEARFHIPVKTNEGVIFMLENERIMMQAGACWYLNLSLEHSVRNESAFERVHLVVDVRVNEWVRALFEKEKSVIGYIDKPGKGTTSTKDQWKIIDELRRHHTETSLALAAQLEDDLITGNKDAYFETALEFLKKIGIETQFSTLQEQQCFLPGLFIKDGRLVIDRKLLLHPGDILHEAAHIALTPAAERSGITGGEVGKSKDAAAEEMAAIAWTYAACVHLQIHPYFVFHGHGYEDAGKHIADNFKEGKYFGVPILQWLGLTGSNDDSITYPAMIKWIRD